MYSFRNDYSEGAHPQVLQALADTNLEQTCGYGLDHHCQEAADLIRSQCMAPEADVHFLVGGTQANLVTITSFLASYEAVIAAHIGHVNTHETGAIEATGHKVLPLPGKDGKISAAQVREAVEAHRADGTHEHMVCPGMVYISHPTELGALYTRGELAALADTCRALGISLYLDGARLGYGLAAQPDVDLPFLAQTCDAFTIGGTKVGMLFGEAIVLCAPALQTCFRYHIKQRGAMLAKGRLLGVQFEAMLEDGSYVALSKTANGMAQELKRAFVSHGCPLLCDTQANQIFPILPDAIAGQLAEKYAFSFWQRVDEAHSAVRFCTSAVTSRADVDALLADIERIFRP